MGTYLCRDESPYPLTGATHPTRAHAKLLSELLFGAHGEFTMINEFLYSELILSKEKAALADLFDCIALVDLRHFQMLSTILKQCGADPKYRTVRGTHTDWWSGRSLSYPTTPANSLDLLCQYKRATIADYTNAIQHCNDDGIARLLLRIRADELCHLDLLSSVTEEV